MASGFYFCLNIFFMTLLLSVVSGITNVDYEKDHEKPLMKPFVKCDKDVCDLRHQYCDKGGFISKICLLVAYRIWILAKCTLFKKMSCAPGQNNGHLPNSATQPTLSSLVPMSNQCSTVTQEQSTLLQQSHTAISRQNNEARNNI
ncbi:hypothetical protein HELRODRAFT_168186 [Helobdella robusta]|uniref:Nodule Cysteine-Rich (NCR) secreted peptide n=1 Tax=Helobdella robusta TaxID=6412 RepID=T1F098_HELRO|nr:hypothetical protein HELRODRAFT_168186 [Helobdella robusta]ESO09224.1 hypothetical protein HELRODRAFT_168186 [Helobdella robusta]